MLGTVPVEREPGLSPFLNPFCPAASFLTNLDDEIYAITA